MYILGVTWPVSWNSAAAILKDGMLLASVEEERLIRVKHAPRIPPLLAMDYCLQVAGITLADVDYIAVSGRPAAVAGLLAFFQSAREGRLHNTLEIVGGSAEQMILEYRLKQAVQHRLRPDARPMKWVFLPHHECHAASAFYGSGFPAANVLTLDGNGENDSGYLGGGGPAGLHRFEKVSPQDSLGYFFAQVTDLLGFRAHSEEGKTMGLAAWGTPTDDLHDVVAFADTSYAIRRDTMHRLQERYGPRREAHRELQDQHRNLAASAQRVLERAGVTLAQRLYRMNRQTSWCLAGGVALNCDMNAKILELPFVERLFIQPAAHDGGTAMGVALALHQRLVGPPPFVMQHAYWGPEYTTEEIESVLKETKVPYERCTDIAATTAERLAQGQMVGWFQGRAEIGPRALGNRSILAHPGLAEMKDRVNRDVKHREYWRPFAPSVLEEHAADFFERAAPSPFMLLTFTVKPSKHRDLAAAMHVDHTARVQTVSRATNPRFYALIEQFGKRTGIPAVLNTSFNDRGEPLVCSPRDALRTFFGTGLDALAIGDFLVTKPCTS